MPGTPDGSFPESPIEGAFAAFAKDLVERIVVLNAEAEAIAEKTGPSKAAKRSLPVVS